jgi:hypothetical protein
LSHIYGGIPSTWSGRFRAAILVGLTALAVIPGWQTLMLWRTYGQTQLFRTDFALYYVFSKIGLTYGWNRLYDLGAQKHIYDSLGSIWWFPLPYTPMMAWLTAPLAALPMQAAYWVWIGAIVVAWAATWWLTAPRDLPLRLLCLLAPLALYLVYLGLSLGQVIVLQMFSVALSYWLMQKRHDVWAGIALVGVLIHPQNFFLIPVVILLTGRWKTFAAFAAVSTAVGTAALISLGVGGTRAYLDRLHMAQVNPDQFWVAPWISLPALLGHHPLRALAVQLMLTAIVLLAAWRSRGKGLELPLAMGLIGSTLVTAFIHLDDLMVLVLAAWLTLRVWPQLWAVALMAIGYWVALLQTNLGTPQFGPLLVAVELIWLFTLALQSAPPELIPRAHDLRPKTAPVSVVSVQEQVPLSRAKATEGSPSGKESAALEDASIS